MNMKINKLLYVSAALLMLAGCDDDWNSDKLDGFIDRPGATDIKNVEYTLTDADYKAIATNKTNKALAEAEGEGEALSALTGNKYFDETITAQEYLPAFLQVKYPTLDDKSSVKVTYNKFMGQPEYLTAIGKAATYRLTANDYKAVWGDAISASFLSPKSEHKIGGLLKEAMPNTKQGDMVMVDYAFSETEPSTGGGQASMAYQKVDAIDAEGGNYIIAATTQDGKTVTFSGLLDESKTYGYGAAQEATLDGNLIAADVAKSLITVAPTEKGFSLQRPDGKFYYLSGTYNSFNVKEALPETGGDWTFRSNGDGTFAIVNVEKDKTVKLTYYAKDDLYEFGAYPGSSFGVYMDESLLGGDDGGFKAQDITLPEVSEYVWKSESKYGWKASCNINKVNYASDSWLVTPVVDLSKATAPVLSIEHALNFLSGNNRADFIELMISDDYAGDATTATWTALEVPTWPEGKNWNFVKSGDIDLSAYQGKKVVLAWHYKSTAECSPTYEVKNVSIKGECKYYYVDVTLYKEIPETDVQPASRATADGCNRTALYAFDGEAWSKHTTAEATLDVMQPADYSSLGVYYVAKPANVLPVYLLNKYPYAQADDKVAVAYYATSKGEVAARELTFNGTEWTMTEETVPFVDQFVKSAGIWKYDPSVVIELPAGKGQPLSSLYFQAMTDWVWENVDVPNGITAKGQGYVTSYGNNEYYTGASAYQGNIDWRASAAKGQYPAEYGSMADDEIVALMRERTIQVMQEVVASLNPDAKMVEGVDVTYTINFGVYTGTAENWTIVYKVVGDGQFEYVEGSLMKRD